jgi:hypothetical protein
VIVDAGVPQKSNQVLSAKFGIKSYPTVVYTNSKGVEVGRMSNRSASALATQFNQIADEHSLQLFLPLSLEEARAAGAEQSKLVIAFFSDTKAKSQPKNDAMVAYLLSDAMESSRGQFIWVKVPLKDGKKTTPAAKAYGASKSPTLVLIDPAGEEGKRSVLKKFTKIKGLAKGLAKALKKASK